MKKAKSLIFIFVAIVIGYVAGTFIGVPEIDGGLVKGDISKASKYTRSLVSPQATAFQNKVLNSEEEYNKASEALNVISSRVNEFNELVNIAIDASEGKDELATSVETLKKVQSLSENAKVAGQKAVDAFESLSDSNKKEAASNYEKASQSLALAYLMLDRQVTVGKEYVTAVDSYFKANKNVNSEVKLAIARDLWADYCAGSAVLNQNDLEVAYWQSKGSLVDEKTIAESGHKIEKEARGSSVSADELIYAISTENAE